jgi:hypothetical protein
LPRPLLLQRMFSRLLMRSCSSKQRK